jgi:hypothetical protein
MKRILKIVLISIIVSVILPITVSAGTMDKDSVSFNWDPVVNALIQVESRGISTAVSGNSCGVLQITPICVMECNQILKRRKSKKRFRLSDRFSIAKSKEMFILIQSFHNPLNDIEKAIRSWNGGMHYSVKRTQRYFEKVMGIMKG